MNTEENCVACCGGPMYCYKYNDKGLKLSKLPLTAFKRNGLQDNVFSTQGTIRYLCQTPMQPCCCPPKETEPAIQTRNSQERHHNCCQKVNCAQPVSSKNCCTAIPVYDNNYCNDGVQICDDYKPSKPEQCECNHTMPLQF